MYSRIDYASNPLGLSGIADRLAFAPYFLFKDLITIFVFMFVLSIFVFFMPNALGDSDNYVIRENFSHCQNELLASNH
jgi:ubiquinol-cytochrome c reductase cytochrome b subunit